MTILHAAAIALGLAAAPGGADACTVDARPVTFGVVDVMRQTFGTGAIVVTCDQPASFAIGLASGSGAGREMTSPRGDRLFYRLFPDATYGVDWGDGAALGPPLRASSDGQGPQRFTVYGVVPAQPGVPEGEYVDSLTVTLEF
jgi:spore coat protein U-like protein